jgi:hypothetical protein
MTAPHTPRPREVPCPNCGQKMNEDDLYCRFCGQPMVATAFSTEGQGTGRTFADADDPPIYDPAEPKPLYDPRGGIREGRARGPALDRVRGASLGCGGLGIVALVGLVGFILIFWFVARPSIDQAARNGVSAGLGHALTTAAPPQPGVPVQLTQGRINDILIADSAFYDPISSPRVTIDDNRVRATFTVYGLAGEYQAGITVQEGRLRLIDPAITGAAGMLIDDVEMTRVIERELLDYTQRTAIGFSGVTVDDGVITLTPVQ